MVETSEGTRQVLLRALEALNETDRLLARTHRLLQGPSVSFDAEAAPDLDDGKDSTVIEWS